MIKAIVFDLDGTLLNTAPDILRVLNASLAKFSLPSVSADKIYMMVGDGAHKLIERAVPADKQQLVEDVYKDYVPAFAACDNANTVLYEGEDEALMRLKAAGVKLAIFSNKPQAATDAVCAQFFGKYNFDIALGQGKFPLKPDPAGLLYIMEQLKVDKSQCVFTGDGETDVRTAHAAGIPCISALWGFRTREQLSACGGNMFAENYTQYLQILHQKFLLNA